MNAPMKAKQFDRSSQTVGNIVHLEHWNVVISDQRLATLFYIVGLGGTRDPFMFPGMENIWINFGRTQVHMPSRGDNPKPEVVRGTLGYVVPDLEALKKRLEYAGSEMKRVAPEKPNKFSWRENDGTVEATCPWGNRVRCHAPSPEFGKTELGLMYIDFDVPPGSAEGIALFYNNVMGAPARGERGRATVSIGRNQHLYFTETTAPIPAYDNHHFQVYIADFSSPYQWLLERDLITMDTDEAEWRFQWIVDPRDSRKLFQIEHEVRSMKHRLFGRPLINRNHAITNMTYVAGRDAFPGVY